MDLFKDPILSSVCVSVHFITRKVYPKLVSKFNSKLNATDIPEGWVCAHTFEGAFFLIHILGDLGAAGHGHAQPFFEGTCFVSCWIQPSWRMQLAKPTRSGWDRCHCCSLPRYAIWHRVADPQLRKVPLQIARAIWRARVFKGEAIDDSGEVWQAFQRVHNKKSHRRIFIICFVVAK